MKFIYHFTVQAYERTYKSNTSAKILDDVTTIHVEALTAEEALMKAKKLIKKKFYRINDVTEVKDMMAEMKAFNEEMLGKMEDLHNPKPPWMQGRPPRKDDDNEPR